jgi:hypothetical protein
MASESADTGISRRYWTAFRRGLSNFWRVTRHASVDAARAFRAAPARIAGVAAALLLAEMVYELFAWGGFHVALSRALDGQYADEAVLGVLAGTLVIPLPYALVGVATRAGLAHVYFGAQGSTKVSRPPFVPLSLVDLIVSIGLTASALVGALPGFAVALIASFAESTRVLALGFIAGVLGAACAVAYVLPGLVFATRIMVLSHRPAAVALREGWDFAKGRRMRLLVLLLLAYAFEAVGLLGAFVFVVGLVVTMPIARGLRDTLITQIYLDIAEDDEQARRRASGVRVFLRR